MNIRKVFALLGTRLSPAILTISFVAGVLPPAHAGDSSAHIVLIVWDGLRPDMVTASNCPTLYNFAQTGTTFSRHHAVYPSTTEVNGTALATGVYPAGSGIVGNHEYRPKININAPIMTASLSAVRSGDEVTKGHYLAVPTIYERLQRQGDFTVVAATKPVGLIPDRSINRSNAAAAKSANVFGGKTLPEDLLPHLESKFGKFPEKPTFPDGPQNKWTLDVLLGSLWKGEVPKLSLLWLSDPDYTQHDTQPGSEKALASLKVNDGLLARLLDTLDKKGLRDKTDIMLVSDHGFSTVDKNVDFAALLTEAGLPASRTFAQEPALGDIMVVGNGGTVFFYVVGGDKPTAKRIVEFLQTSEHCGVIFCEDPLPGTFPLSAAHVNSPEAPQVIVSLRWNRSPNASGTKGMIIGDSTSKKQPGHGMHGSLSPYDMHNTLIASGPHFRQEFVDDLPSGNVDIGPTIFWLLGIAPNYKVDGRVLSESFRKNPFPELKCQEKTLMSDPLENQPWRQYLKISTVDGTEYLDEGNFGDFKK